WRTEAVRISLGESIVAMDREPHAGEIELGVSARGRARTRRLDAEETPPELDARRWIVRREKEERDARSHGCRTMLRRAQPGDDLALRPRDAPQADEAFALAQEVDALALALRLEDRLREIDEASHLASDERVRPHVVEEIERSFAIAP